MKTVCQILGVFVLLFSFSAFADSYDRGGWSPSRPGYPTRDGGQYITCTGNEPNCYVCVEVNPITQTCSCPAGYDDGGRPEMIGRDYRGNLYLHTCEASYHSPGRPGRPGRPPSHGYAGDYDQCTGNSPYCNVCERANPVTGACSCPAGSWADQPQLIGRDGRKGNIYRYTCQSYGRPVPPPYYNGGDYEQCTGNEPYCHVCERPNPATGSCSCPRGYRAGEAELIRRDSQKGNIYRFTCY